MSNYPQRGTETVLYNSGSPDPLGDKDAVRTAFLRAVETATRLRCQNHLLLEDRGIFVDKMESKKMKESGQEGDNRILEDPARKTVGPLEQQRELHTGDCMEYRMEGAEQQTGRVSNSRKP